MDQVPELTTSKESRKDLKGALHVEKNKQTNINIPEVCQVRAKIPLSCYPKLIKIIFRCCYLISALLWMGF